MVNLLIDPFNREYVCHSSCFQMCNVVVSCKDFHGPIGF